MPYCWKCKAPYTEFKKPGFHDACEKCQNYWHSCCNCKFFTGFPTARCRIPNVEPVHDFEGANFCDEFQFAEPAKEEAPKTTVTRTGSSKSGSSKNGGDRGGNSTPTSSSDARRKWDELFRK